MNNHDLFLLVNGKLKPISTDQITMIEASTNYSIVYTNGQAFTITLQLHNIERKLPAGQFCRVHRHYIISIRHITYIEKNSVVIADKEIPIGETYQQDFFRRLIVLR